MDSEKVLRGELSALLRGGNAHMNFDELVADFPIAHINDKAPNMPYSFWQIIEHMRIAQWDILEFIRNPDHVSPHYPEGYRPGPGKKTEERGWRKTLSAFRSDLEALDRIINDPKTNPFTPIPHAKEYNIFREILLAADHNAYHMGELAIIRQVMDLWPAGKKYLTGTPE